MKSLKTKVIMSAVVLVFALLATIGSTYAWFTVSTEVSVSGIELNVQSDESLLIMIDDGYDIVTNAALLYDASNYGIALTNANIVATTTYADLGTWTMGTVTAAEGNTDDTDLLYTGLNDGGSPLVTTLRTMDLDTKYTVAGSPNAGGDFIQISFWLMSQSATTEDIVLQDLVFTSDGGNTSGQDAVVNSLRLLTHVATEDDCIFATGPDYDFLFNLGDPGYDAVNTWENFIIAGTKTTLLGDHSEYYNTAQSGDVSGTYVGTTSGIASATTIATLASNTPTKVTVSIYIEGWDVDASVDILNAAFTASWVFAISSLA